MEFENLVIKFTYEKFLPHPQIDHLKSRIRTNIGFIEEFGGNYYLIRPYKGKKDILIKYVTDYSEERSDPVQKIKIIEDIFPLFNQNLESGICPECGSEKVDFLKFCNAGAIYNCQNCKQKFNVILFLYSTRLDTPFPSKNGEEQETKRLTYVDPSECVSLPCQEDVKRQGNIVNRKVGNVYLGYQVTDINVPGLSDVEEIQDILVQIEQDYNTKTIPRFVLWGRMHQLIMIMRRTKLGNLGDSKNKNKALDMINSYMSKYGFGTYDLMGKRMK